VPISPFFDSSKPDSQKIWRYINFYKFIDLITTGDLYFSRANCLGDDPLEGKITNATVEKIREQHHDDIADGDRVVGKFLNLFQCAPIHEFVTCWHMDTEESNEMWKQHAKGGIVIQSTIDGFIKSIKQQDNGFLFAKVKYIEEKDILQWNYIEAPLAYKRKHYNSESEFRAIYFDGKLDETEYLTDHTDLPRGRHFKIYLECLIHRVYVHPGANDLFFRCTKKSMEKCGILDECIVDCKLRKLNLAKPAR